CRLPYLTPERCMSEHLERGTSGSRTASSRAGRSVPPFWRRPWFMVGAVALMALAGVLWTWRAESVESTRLTRRDVVRTLVLTGRVRGQGRVQLGRAVGGSVVDVRVREGERVSAGQLLMRIDDAQQAAALAQSRAALSTAVARTRATREQAELRAQS